MVRDFITGCKPDALARELEINSVWSNGNFSQKMIVEPEIVSARRHPGLSEKVARRRTYAVLWERTITSNRSGRDGELDDDINGTTVDDMQVFTTKSLANWEAKKVYHGWYQEHLRKPQDKVPSPDTG